MLQRTHVFYSSPLDFSSKCYLPRSQWQNGKFLDILTNPFLDPFVYFSFRTHIIIDEVHERDINIDFLLLLTRRFLTSNSPNSVSQLFVYLSQLFIYVSQLIVYICKQSVYICSAIYLWLSAICLHCPAVYLRLSVVSLRHRYVNWRSRP